MILVVLVELLCCARANLRSFFQSWLLDCFEAVALVKGSGCQEDCYLREHRCRERSRFPDTIIWLQQLFAVVITASNRKR